VAGEIEARIRESFTPAATVGEADAAVETEE
jgi:hypothetical protein